MDKQARHFTIKEIIETLNMSSQDDLIIELKKRGYIVTQATLSRDLKEIGIGRLTTGDGAKYILQPIAEVQALRPLIIPQIHSITANESLIVIQTLPSCASIVGEYLDNQKNSDIIGTIAGDNTLLVIPKTQNKIKNIIKYLRNKLIEGEK